MCQSSFLALAATQHPKGQHESTERPAVARRHRSDGAAIAPGAIARRWAPRVGVRCGVHGRIAGIAGKRNGDIVVATRVASRGHAARVGTAWQIGGCVGAYRWITDGWGDSYQNRLAR